MVFDKDPAMEIMESIGPVVWVLLALSISQIVFWIKSLVEYSNGYECDQPLNVILWIFTALITLSLVIELYTVEVKIGFRPTVGLLAIINGGVGIHLSNKVDHCSEGFFDTFSVYLYISIVGNSLWYAINICILASYGFPTERPRTLTRFPTREPTRAPRGPVIQIPVRTGQTAGEAPAPYAEEASTHGGEDIDIPVAKMIVAV